MERKVFIIEAVGRPIIIQMFVDKLEVPCPGKPILNTTNGYNQFDHLSPN